MSIVEELLSTSPIVIYDTEYTSWEGAAARDWSGPGEYREIVQIGAVLLDKNLEERAAFSQLARPKMNPVLSDYFVELTGITNTALSSEGRPLSEVLANFHQFCTGAVWVSAFGPDHEVIEENCKLVALVNPLASLKLVDVKPDLCAIAGVRLNEIHSSGLPALFGLPLQPRAHDGLSDARAIASILRHLWL